MFYVIITPILTVTMTKIMFQSENKMIVADAFKRIDSVMNISPLESTKCQKPTDASVQLKNVATAMMERSRQLTMFRLTLNQVRQLHLSVRQAVAKQRSQTLLQDFLTRTAVKFL